MVDGGYAEHLVTTGEFTSAVSKPLELVAITWYVNPGMQSVRWRLRTIARATRQWMR